MKRIFYIIALILIISCGQEKVKTETPKSEQVAQDSISYDNFGKRKSIHQQEWEEHRKELGVDTLEIQINQ